MRLLHCLLLVAALSGCVSSGQPGQVDQDQILENRVQLALGYMGSGDRESARHHLAKAAEISPRAPSVLHAYALLYQSEGELDVADSHYRRAIAAERGFSQARLNYGVFLYGQQRFDDAYQQFAAVTEDLDYQLRALAFSHLGLTAIHLGRTEQAESAFRRAIQLDPGFARPYLELAQLDFDGGDYVRSKQWLDQYNRLTQASSASLWLGVRLASAFDDRDAVASNALALRNLFPYSEEALAYQEWLREQHD